MKNALLLVLRVTTIQKLKFKIALNMKEHQAC